MRTLNLGILAHVDAGKTSLTERLLFHVGVTDQLGSVDTGNTQTDSLALERERGITIKAAVASFLLGETAINLFDTPGHPDFIAEVERVLVMLDSAVVVVSAAEGVQAQTRILVRALRRLSVPILIFVNKIDRTGADCDAVLAQIATQLALRPVTMGTVTAAGSKQANVSECEVNDPQYQAILCDKLTESDDQLLAEYVTSPSSLTPQRLESELVDQIAQGLVHPVFFGSATTGAGLTALIQGIERLLPARLPDADGPVSGRIFKIERGWGGQKLCYLSLDSGTIYARQSILLPKGHARVTAIDLVNGASSKLATKLEAGQIARVAGLSEARIGDVVGWLSTTTSNTHFAPPTLETRIRPNHPSEGANLWIALSQLAEQDPLINLRRSDDEKHVYVSLYGEVQKEVIRATLLSDFGLCSEFEESTVICIERVTEIGEALEEIFRESNPYLATVGLRVDPTPIGTGASFQIEVDSGLMPTSFYRAVEEAVWDTLSQGPSGWKVTDCRVSMTAAQQSSPSSTAADFRELTPLVLASALARAKTVVCAPFNSFRIDAPADSMVSLMTVLSKDGAVISSTSVADGQVRIEGSIAASKVHGIQQRIPGLTSGLGVMESTLERYGPAPSPSPTRPRVGPNPFNREEYLHRVRRNLAVTTTMEG